ncbi:MAG: Mu-like prophage major head subunit gpT family protein [Desulfobacterales bacterium]|nr:Mu-like prophage major head subunit gpT family protein [Desulfobacterales bacterium]
MLINKNNLTAVFLNLKTTFNKAFESAPANWQKVAMRVPSTSATNNYDWIDRFPKMIEWVGDKVVKALKAHEYTIKNKDFEATVGVLRNDIEDDQLGIYGPMAQDAGFSAKQWPDELIADLLNGAFAAECFDGQYFYDTDHEVAGASVSNKGTAALSAATLSAAQNSYGAGRAAIMNFTDDESRPLNLVPDLLEVPPALEATAKLICHGDFLVDGSSNPYKGTAEVFVNPRITDSSNWFLHVTSRPVKPFIFQERKAPVFVSQTNENNDDVFNKALFKYGAEARGNAGYGLWQLSYGSTGAA